MAAILFLRRWNFCSSRISKISVSFYHRESDANPSVPWLMLPPEVDGSGNIAYNFHCLAKKKKSTYTNKIGELLPVDINLIKDVKFVGSSNGWLALYNRRNCDLFLSNPISDRHIKLPPLGLGGAPDRVILDDGRLLAFMTYGRQRTRKLAFCSSSSSSSKEWTPIRRYHHAYDNIVYSSRHKRLFCICESEIIKYKKRIGLECWDFFAQEPTRLDWEIKRNKELQFDEFGWQEMSHLKLECFQIKYLVCAEHSGELFLVVRHVNRHAGPSGSFVSNRYMKDLRTPYRTIDFDVYRIDTERREVIHMKHSLQGLAMFVGINQPFAIPAEGVAGAGLISNSVYFADENRLVESKLTATCGGHDNGIFDYQNKHLHPCCDFYPIEYDKIRNILPLPLWFTPTPPPLSEIYFSYSKASFCASPPNTIIFCGWVLSVQK